MSLISLPPGENGRLEFARPIRLSLRCPVIPAVCHLGDGLQVPLSPGRHAVPACPDPDGDRLGGPPGMACGREPLRPEDLPAEPAPLHPAGIRACGNDVHLLLRHQQDPGGGGDFAPVSVSGARRRLRPGLLRGAPLHGQPSWPLRAPVSAAIWPSAPIRSTC